MSDDATSKARAVALGEAAKLCDNFRTEMGKAYRRDFCDLPDSIVAIYVGSECAARHMANQIRDLIDVSEPKD